jgi:SpoVK/Ycf46/Vps4 family AAA+-type ATPase
MSDLSVSLIAGGAVVVGAIVGQVSAVVSTVVTGRRDRTGAQEKRRREAYAAFIDATQGILQSVSGLPPIEQTRQGTVTDRTLEEVAKLQRAWATVVIVGTMAAWDASNVVKDAASRIASVFLYELPDGQRSSREGLADLAAELRTECDKFVEVARRELN